MHCMKRVSAIVCMLIIVLITGTVGVKPAYAAESATVSVSSKSVEVGKEFSVTVKVSATSEIAMFQFTLVYDKTKLEYVSGACDHIEKGDPNNRIVVVNQGADKYSYEFTFKALAVGTTSLSLADVVVCPIDINIGDAFPLNKSNGTITVTAPPEASHNAYLKKLSLGGVKISPDFNKETLAYTASVDGTVTKVTVTAEPEDVKAKVVKSGTDNLKEGNNTVTVKVTAEDGKTTKTYTITVNRGKAPTPKPATPTPTPTPPVKAKVGETELEVNGKPDAKYLEETEVWQSTTVEYKKCKIEALKNLITGDTVVEFSDGNLYILDTEKGTAYRYMVVDNPKQSIVLVEADDNVTVPTGYQKTKRNLNGTEITAYISSETSEYALVYAKDVKGIAGWYQWDTTVDTFQRFNTEDVTLIPTPTPTPMPTPTPEPTPTPTPEPTEATQDNETQRASTADDETKNGKTFKDYLWMGAAGLMFVLMLVFLILYLVQKGRYARRFAPDDTDLYDDSNDYL